MYLDMIMYLSIVSYQRSYATKEKSWLHAGRLGSLFHASHRQVLGCSTRKLQQQAKLDLYAIHCSFEAEQVEVMSLTEDLDADNYPM